MDGTAAADNCMDPTERRSVLRRGRSASASIAARCTTTLMGFGAAPIGEIYERFSERDAEAVLT